MPILSVIKFFAVSCAPLISVALPIHPHWVPEWDGERVLTALRIERIPFDHIDGNIQGFLNTYSKEPGSKTFVSMTFVTRLHRGT